MTDTHEIDRELVMAWMDSELSPAQAQEIETHVNACAACRQLAAELRDVSARVSAWTVSAAPASLFPPDVERRRSARTSWFSLPAWPRWSYALAGAGITVVALMATSTWVMRSAMDPEREIGAGIASSGSAAGSPSARLSMPRSTDAFEKGQGQQGQPAAEPQVAVSTLMIVRSASIQVLTEKFDEARASLERLVRAHEGSIAQLQVTGYEPSQRSLGATVRVPNARMDAALEAIRQIGKVRTESQSSEDVTDSFRDLSVRIANARIEERRLNDLLARRTGDLGDVLAVEQQVMRVRGEIERMDAQSRAVQGRVAQSTIIVQLDEAYRADLATGPLPLTTRFTNALVDGTRGAIDSLVTVGIGLLTIGPSLLVWGVLVGLPGWFLLKRVRRSNSR